MCIKMVRLRQILLGLDEKHGTRLTHVQIARSYAVCPAALTNVIQCYVKNGITDIVRYNISPNFSAARRNPGDAHKLIPNVSETVLASYLSKASEVCWSWLSGWTQCRMQTNLALRKRTWSGSKQDRAVRQGKQEEIV